MANKLFTQADAQTGATGNPITEAEAIAFTKDPAKKFRWDPINPLTPGYDPVPVYIEGIVNDVATFKIVNANDGAVIADRFTIDLTDRRLCHSRLPSTPRKNLAGKRRIVILMVCATYHQDPATVADTTRTFTAVAKEASVALTATGKWPQTESAPIVDAIIDAVKAGKKVDLKFLRKLYRERLIVSPELRIPKGLGSL